MSLVFVFLLGIANFALHKAVLESRHPMLAQLPLLFGGQHIRLSLVIEFAMLAGTMLIVADGGSGWTWGYAGYSLMNGLSAWLILTHRV